MNTNTFIISMAILVFLDLFLTLIRYSLVNAHLPRLLNLREGKEELVDRTIKTIERPRIRVSLRLAASLIHLFIGALSIFFLSLKMTNPNPAWLRFLIILAVGIILVFGEALAERMALINPDNWSLRISGFGKLVDILFAPLTAIVVRFSGQSNITMQQFTPPTYDELKSWVETGQSDGALEKEERQMS